MPEVSALEKPPIGAVEGRPGVTLVDNSNFNDYVDEKLGTPPAGVTENVDNPEAAAAAELAEIEAKAAAEKAAAAQPKEGDTDGSKVFFQGKWVGKHDFNYRVHLKAEEAKKEAQEKIDAAAAEAKSAKEQAEALQRERDELKAKYEPPPPAELGPKPQPSDFADVGKYGEALEAWAADKALRNAAKAQADREEAKAKEAATKAWGERVKAIQAELPDYEAKLNASQLTVSDQMRDAILESEVGPRILYHFAEHPDEAEAMKKLSVRQMLVQFGKLEAKLGSADKPQTKSASAAQVAEISKAPAPISPLKGGNSGNGSAVMDANGNVVGGYEAYKAARLAGKIK